MSEATIQAGLKTLLQAMSEFADADVVINDWSLLDGEIIGAPFVIIESADEFTSGQTAKTATTEYSIKIHLFERFTTWTESLNNLTTRRDAILSMMNDADTDARTADGINGVDIAQINAGGPIEPWYYRYIDPEEYQNATPQMIAQTLIMLAREY